MQCSWKVGSPQQLGLSEHERQRCLRPWSTTCCCCRSCDNGGQLRVKSGARPVLMCVLQPYARHDADARQIGERQNKRLTRQPFVCLDNKSRAAFYSRVVARSKFRWAPKRTNTAGLSTLPDPTSDKRACRPPLRLSHGALNELEPTACDIRLPVSALTLQC